MSDYHAAVPTCTLRMAGLEQITDTSAGRAVHPLLIADRAKDCFRNLSVTCARRLAVERLKSLHVQKRAPQPWMGIVGRGSRTHRIHQFREVSCSTRAAAYPAPRLNRNRKRVTVSQIACQPNTRSAQSPARHNVNFIAISSTVFRPAIAQKLNAGATEFARSLTKTMSSVVHSGSSVLESSLGSSHRLRHHFSHAPTPTHDNGSVILTLIIWISPQILPRQRKRIESQRVQIRRHRKP
jgi:hypothetical protein